MRAASGPLMLVCLAGAPALAAQQTPVRFAQALVNQMVRAHVALVAVELAVDSAGTCKTIAATDPKDVGERCDDDEIGPMRTGEPDVAAPTRDDPVYDITQALHDATGRLIGAVGMDIKPMAGQDRAAALAVARGLLRELEARIPSMHRLFEP